VLWWPIQRQSGSAAIHPSVCLSVCLSHAHSSEMVHFRHVVSTTRNLPRLDVEWTNVLVLHSHIAGRLTATQPSLSPVLQNQSLGGCTISIELPLLAGHIVLLCVFVAITVSAWNQVAVSIDLMMLLMMMCCHCLSVCLSVCLVSIWAAGQAHNFYWQVLKVCLQLYWELSNWELSVVMFVCIATQSQCTMTIAVCYFISQVGESVEGGD